MSLFKSNKKTLSMDFGACEVKVVEGKFNKKGVNISKYFSIKIPEEIYNDGQILEMERLSHVIKNGLKENKSSVDFVNAVVNSSEIITREITIPKVTHEQIEAIINFQLEDYIPINPDDFIVKHLVLGSTIEDGIEKLNLLLIGVPKAIVESHLNLLRSIGLKPSILDYQGNAINKLIKLGGSVNGRTETKEITIASIDLGHDNTKLTIVKDGAIKVSRVIEVGGIELGDSKELTSDKVKSTINDILDRVELIFRYYKTRDIGNDIELVLLQGGLSNINGISKLFTDYFNIPSVKLSSFNKLKFSGDLSKYGNAIGGLIRNDEVKK